MAHPMEIAVLERIRRWPVWTTPGAFLAWLSATVVLAVTLAVKDASTTAFRPREFGTALVLLGCAAVCIEATRRIREPAGVAYDLLSAWALPIALLLPPVYALLAPLPLTVFKQLRIRRGLVHRRVYSAAAIGLGNWVASMTFHQYEALGAQVLTPATPVGRVALVLVALACGALGSAANVLLIAAAARLASLEATWRQLLGGREERVLEGGELCLGVAVAGCWQASPALALVMLVPVLLVQRSLGHSQLQAAARTDPKTGLLNSTAWQEEAEREIVRARREQRPLAVLLADLDHFKLVNDGYGHLVGDRALIAAARALHEGLRDYDLLGRFGGEEFTALLPNADAVEARRVAERLRWALAASPIVVDDGRAVELTVSIGVAVLDRHGSDLTDLLAAADLAVYRAKADGRNRVAVAP